MHDAVQALARHYEAEDEQRTPPRPHLAERSERIFDAVQRVCEWRLGRGRIVAEPGSESELPDGVNSVAEIVACLKRIRKSVQLWTKEYGRQGYLNYVQKFIL
jgi:hypothetical protein